MNDSKKKLKIGIADDEGHIRYLLKDALENMNVEIVGEAANGEEAVEMYMREKPHLLLLDINMPILTGEDALKQIMSESPNALVIMLSAAFDRETVQRCMKLGASNFIPKNSSIEETKKIIKTTWEAYKKRMKKTEQNGSK